PSSTGWRHLSGTWTRPRPEPMNDGPIAATLTQAPAAATPSAAVASPRQRLLEGAILPTMLRLAAPTLVVLVVQTLVRVIGAYFVSFLGTDALAGVALVFPVLMLMQMMSNGAIGGGVASAVARALGAGRRDEATALVLHALVLAVGFGAVFTAAEWLGGRA